MGWWSGHPEGCCILPSLSSFWGTVTLRFFTCCSWIVLTSRQRNEVGHNMFVILVDAVTSSHVVFVVSLATVSLEDSLKSLEVA